MSHMETDEKIWLTVPYRERQQAKALGARWDPNKSAWYINSKKNLGLVERWMCFSSHLSRVRVLRYCYLLQRRYLCSRCNNMMPVYCLAIRQFMLGQQKELHTGCFTLFNITTPPLQLYREIQRHCFTYGVLDGSAAFHNSQSVLQNHCLCGNLLLDNEIHKPGPSGFRPLMATDATAIECVASLTPPQKPLHCQWRSNPEILACLKKG